MFKLLFPCVSYIFLVSRSLSVVVSGRSEHLPYLITDLQLFRRQFYFRGREVLVQLLDSRGAAENRGYCFITKYPSYGKLWQRTSMLLGQLLDFFHGMGSQGSIGSLPLFLNTTVSNGNYAEVYPRMEGTNPYAVGAKFEFFDPGTANNPGARPFYTATSRVLYRDSPCTLQCRS